LLCGRQTPEDLILPSLVLLCTQPLQFGLELFPCHDASSKLLGELAALLNTVYSLLLGTSRATGSNQTGELVRHRTEVQVRRYVGGNSPPEAPFPPLNEWLTNPTDPPARIEPLRHIANATKGVRENLYVVCFTPCAAASAALR
jgi:hypothetical protein